MARRPESLIIDLLDHEPRRVLDAMRRSRPRAHPYTDDDVAQLAIAMAALIREAAEAQGDSMRRSFLRVLIPALRAEGETLTSLMTWNASYYSLLTFDLASAVDPADREAVASWLMSFAGSFLADVAEIAVD